MTAQRFKTTPDGGVSDVEDFPVTIKQGSNIIVDIAAVHMNRVLYFLWCV